MKQLSYTLLLLILLGIGSARAANPSDKVSQIVKKQAEINDDSAKSHDKIAELSRKEKRLYDKFQLVQRKIENARTYNEQMRSLITSQKEEMKSINQQIKSLKETNKKILPFMSRMIQSLEKFIELDMPFLKNKRQKRVADLKKLMDQADVATSEKFRRVLDAYQKENEYGRTIEAYRGQKKIGGEKVTVDYLRIGRIALFYQTLDREKTFAWDKANEKWIDVRSKYTEAVDKAIRVAREQIPPDLLELPIAKNEVQP